MSNINANRHLEALRTIASLEDSGVGPDDDRFGDALRQLDESWVEVGTCKPADYHEVLANEPQNVIYLGLDFYASKNA